MAFYNEEYGHSTFSYWLGNPKDALNVFAAGYRSAAEHLAESLLQRPGFPAHEAYPIVFLYCHALELSLKHAIYKAAEFADYAGASEVEGRLRNIHDLQKLSKSLVRSLELLFPEDVFLRDLVQRITTTSHELDAMVVTSFRYPIDQIGRPAAESNRSINLRAFAQHMSSLLEDVDTLNFGLDAQTYIAQEAFTESVLAGLYASGG